MIDKAGKNYIYYGNFRNLKGMKVGIYHTWCEVLINNSWYIIDPSIKYNKSFLKREINFKCSPKIPDIIVTEERKNYNWQYLEKESLSNYPNSYINMIGEDLKEFLVNSLIKVFPEVPV